MITLRSTHMRASWDRSQIGLTTLVATVTSGFAEIHSQTLKYRATYLLIDKSGALVNAIYIKKMSWTLGEL